MKQNEDSVDVNLICYELCCDLYMIYSTEGYINAQEESVGLWIEHSARLVA